MTARTSYRRRLALTGLAAFGLLAPALISMAPAASAAQAATPSAASASSLCAPSAHHISCLSERKPAHSMKASTLTRASTPDTLYYPNNPYTPAQLRAAYKIPASTSTATIAIVDAYDAPNVASDMATYRSTYGLPACTASNGCFHKVNQDGLASPLPGQDPSSYPGWAGETTLDVQMVSAICPTCHILLVESNDADDSGQPNMEVAVKTATNLGAKYVSMSWGGSETFTETTTDANYLSTPGVAYVAAAGDNDYGTSWPAVNPNVVAVGGTSLYLDTASSRGYNDQVWGYQDGSGTGSGCSTYEARPAWQAIAPITSLCGNRSMNDVSIVADPNTGVSVWEDGQWWSYGGTSAGTPMIAALYAMAGTPSSAPAPSYPYAHRANFADVIGNANALCGSALCTGVAGYDGPTGLGTPIGVAGFSSITTPSRITVHNPGTITAPAGTPRNLDVRATDSNGLSLSYSATGLPPGMAVDSTGYTYGSPTRTGAYNVTITARNVFGNSGSATFRLNVVLHRMTTAIVPRISGAQRRGYTVSASYGGFRADTSSGRPISPRVGFQWYVDGRPIAGAVHSTFKIPASYYHHRICFHMVASATYYSNYGYISAYSAPIA